MCFCCYLFSIFQKPWWWPQCHMYFTCLFIVSLFPDSNIKPDSPGLRKLYLAKGCMGFCFRYCKCLYPGTKMTENKSKSILKSSHLNAILCHSQVLPRSGMQASSSKAIPNYYSTHKSSTNKKSMTRVSDQNKGNQNWVGPSGAKYIKLTGSSLVLWVLWISPLQKLKDWIDAFPSWLILPKSQTCARVTEFLRATTFT